MNTLVAYLGDAKVKDKYLKRVKEHYKGDEIVHGYYWENGKGCAVGCTIEGSDHFRYETELGIPVSVAYLEDRIFEGLSNGEAKEFPIKFLKAIKPGADLSLVTPKFMVWLMKEQEQYSGVQTCPDVLGVLKQVGLLYQRLVEGEDVSSNDWSAAWSAESAARSAAWSAAWSAESAARSAAWSAESAAWSAESAARSAAWSAESAAWSAESAARSAAWSAAYKKMADKFISLLKEAK